MSLSMHPSKFLRIKKSFDRSQSTCPSEYKIQNLTGVEPVKELQPFLTCWFGDKKERYWVSWPAPLVLALDNDLVLAAGLQGVKHVTPRLVGRVATAVHLQYHINTLVIGMLGVAMHNFHWPVSYLEQCYANDSSYRTLDHSEAETQKGKYSVCSKIQLAADTADKIWYF